MALDLRNLDGSDGFRLDGIDRLDQSGSSVAGAGDINGDGFSDLIIGARYGDPDDKLNAGETYLVFGLDSGFGPSIDLATLDGSNGLRLDGIEAADLSGFSVAGAGDINGDEIGDLIIGAPTAAANGIPTAGESYVVFGLAGGLTASLQLETLDGTSGFRLDGAKDYGRSGFSVAAAGDVNGDGLGDLIVGAPNADRDDGTYDAGASYIIFGSTSGFDASLNLSALKGSNGFRLEGIDPFGSFGYSVAGAGDVNGDGFDDVIVGAPDVGDYSAGTARTGASYIIFGSDDDFSSSFDLSSLDGTNGFLLDGADPYDRSGFSVAGAGDVNGDGLGDLIVGSPVAGDYDEGKSYVVFGSEADFNASLDLANLDGSNGFQLVGADDGDQAGLSVAGAGDVNGDGLGDLIVGAWLAAPDGTPTAGASYVVLGTTASFDASIDLGEITGSTGFRLDGSARDDGSGRSVASAGDVNGDGFDDLIVGARYADPNGNQTAGETYVIFGSGAIGGDNDVPVAAADELVVASFDQADLAADTGAGADHDADFDDLSIVTIDGTVVAPGGSVTLSSGLRVTLLRGTQVQFDAPEAELGARLSDTFLYEVSDGRGGSDTTAVTVEFTQNAIALADLNGTSGFRILGAAAYDFSGRSVAGAGDVNGDGYDDVLIGASGADPDGTYNAGASYVVFGSEVGFSPDLDLAELDGSNGFRLDGADAYDFSGVSTAAAGDVNGDGFDDLIVGAFDADPEGRESAGESYVVFGSDNGFPASVDLADLDGTNGFRIDGVDAGDASGYSVAGAGDVNGDGFDDLLVGAPGVGDYYAGNDRTGASYVIFGAVGGFSAGLNLADLDGANGLRIDGPDGYDASGTSVAAAGDVNGDGIEDLIVGAQFADADGNLQAGQSYVVFGTQEAFHSSLALADLNGANGFRLDGDTAYDQSGVSVAGAGDVNGDGFDDLIVGAFGTNAAGRSYVVFGSNAGFPASVDLGALDGSDGFRLEGVSAFDYSGRSVAGAGDFNGDGFDDLIVGAPGIDDAGESYLIFGSDAGFAARIDLGDLDGLEGFRLVGVDAYDDSGRSVAGAGDVNGDGLDDLIVGAQGADPNGNLDSGESYVIFGVPDGADGPVRISQTVSFDGEQAGNGTFGTRQSAKDALSIGGGHRAGLVFEDVALPEEAEVQTATATLTAQGSKGPSTTIEIRLYDNPDGIAACGRGVLSDPGFDTFDFIPFVAGSWSKGETIVSPDLAAQVQELVDGGAGTDGDFDLAFSLSAAKGLHEIQPEEFGDGVAAVLDISYIVPDIA